MIAEYRCAYCGKEKTATDKEKPLLLEGERVCADCHQTHRGVPASNPIPKKPSPWASKGTRKRGAVPGLVKGSAGAHPRPEPVEVAAAPALISLLTAEPAPCLQSELVAEEAAL